MNKKVTTAIASVGFALPMLAQEVSGGDAATILNGASSALSGLISTAVPIVVTIMGSGLAIWGGMKLVRLVMRAFGIGTSR